LNGEIHVRVNGEELAVPEGASVSHLLERLKVSVPRCAVERNREIVPKSAYGSLSLADGDILEIVELVGGG
jgi:thiamine biosynthesis protein ThiS